MATRPDSSGLGLHLIHQWCDFVVPTLIVLVLHPVFGFVEEENTFMAFLTRLSLARACVTGRSTAALAVIRTNYWDALKEWKEPERVGEPLEVLRRRLLYQSKQRGFKENDMLIGAFAEKYRMLFMFH